MPIFEHTAREPGMWRGWIKNGDSLEITWPKNSVGVRYALTDTDGYGSHKQLWIGLGFIQAFIPLGSDEKEFPAMERPQWGFDLSREFGIVLHWNKRRKSWDWPFHVTNLANEELTNDGRWVDVMAKYRDGEKETLWSETHP